MRFTASLFSALLLVSSFAKACTIFVLTNESRTLFFNNEDWSNPESRLWFVSAGKDHLGCAYVGFDDGWAQGGVNTAGLAFDWVAGETVNYTPANDLARVRGNSAQRMLETCASVDEAIAFYRTHRETEFARARILIADRSGNSVIIGAKDGALTFDRRAGNRGFGYGWKVLQEQLTPTLDPTVANGVKILRACAQPGATPTQYSNVFDLRSLEITVYPAPTSGNGVRLDLTAELAKGDHSYRIRHLESELHEAPLPLRNEQKRFYLDEFSGRERDEPQVTAKVSKVLRECAAGQMQADDFTPDFWKALAPSRKEMHDQVTQLGSLRKVVVVDRSDHSHGATYRCIATFQQARVLQRLEFDAEGKIAAIATEFVELERP